LICLFTVAWLLFFAGGALAAVPVVTVNTLDSVPVASREEYVFMSFALTDSANPRNNIAANADMAGRIRGRGNNSWRDFRANKKSYRVKFKSKTSLFGLEAAKDWVLLAQHRDETLLYNAVAFELGRRFGLPFNHSFNFVDLYINGEYRGIYLLTEHNQVGSGRVAIERKGGWFAELDEYYDKEPRFRTGNYGLPVMIKSPKGGKAWQEGENPAHIQVKSDFNALADALASPDFPESGYREMVDIGTFIDFLLINELAANTDLSHPRSVFLYKDRGGLISMGPLWDFDSGYGWSYRNWMESGFNDHFNHPERRPPVHPFFGRFYEDPAFAAAYRERWNGMYDTIASIPAFIDEMAGRLSGPAERNFDRWWYKTYAPFTDTRPAQPNVFGDAVVRLKNWYAARVYYLNALFGGGGDIVPEIKVPLVQSGGTNEVYLQALPQGKTVFADTLPAVAAAPEVVRKRRGFFGFLAFWRR